MSLIRVAVVLPQREKFGPKVAGAIALTVRDFVHGTNKQSITTVLGHQQNDTFENIDFIGIEDKKFQLFSRSKSYTKQCINALNKVAVDIIEVHNRVAAAIAIKKAFPQLRVALYLHNDPHTIRGLKTSAERVKVCEVLDVVICVSEFVKSRFVYKNTSPSNVFTVFNALSGLPFIVSLEQKKPLIVFAGRIVPDKGPLLLAQALRKVLPQHSEWRCVFVGAAFYGATEPQTDYEKEVIATISGLGGAVEYMNSQPNQRVMDLLRQASIMVMPSVWEEPFGRSLLEAMASGCACITTRRGGLPEVAGEHAIVLNTITNETIADALHLLITNATLCKQTQRFGKQYIESRFSIETQSNKLHNIRSQLLQY